jgi:hypothetical protein
VEFCSAIAGGGDDEEESSTTTEVTPAPTTTDETPAPTTTSAAEEPTETAGEGDDDDEEEEGGEETSAGSSIPVPTPTGEPTKTDDGAEPTGSNPAEGGAARLMGGLGMVLLGAAVAL